MDITGCFKKENIIVVYADFSSVDFYGIDFVRSVGLECIAFHRI